MAKRSGDVEGEHRTERERGVALVLTAASLLVLMGMAGFAIDLGWLYVKTTEAQKAAESAALAGVVHMPVPLGTPFSSSEGYTTAIDVAGRNGYTTGGVTTVAPTEVAGKPHQLNVAVTTSVPTFFMKVFGISTVGYTRDATAEYIPPLPMGSPNSTFGNEPGCAPNINTESNCPNFWGNIHGRYTDRIMGDAFSSSCVGSNGSGCTANTWWRSDGYVLALEVPESGTVTLDVVDPSFVQGGGNNINAGDNEVDGNAGPTTEFTVFDRIPVIAQVFDGTPICQRTYTPEPVGTPFVWENLCTLNSLQPGFYPLRVKILGNNYGLNRWSLRASSTSTQQPRIYALGDMSIYANVDAGLTEFFLAEVSQLNAGKTLLIDLFDPGDAAGDNEIRIVNPFGASPPCHLEVPNDSIDRNLSSCVIDTTRPANNYNGDWLHVAIDLPPSYTCNGSDCWWKVVYDYEGDATDTTTWSARMEGNPIHLVP